MNSTLILMLYYIYIRRPYVVSSLQFNTKQMMHYCFHFDKYVRSNYSTCSRYYAIVFYLSFKRIVFNFCELTSLLWSPHTGHQQDLVMANTSNHFEMFNGDNTFLLNFVEVWSPGDNWGEII